MVYSIFWRRLFYHSSSWTTPPDLWETFRSAQYVSWGGIGQIYNNQAAFQTFPGIALLLAPIAKLTSVWHLSTSFPFWLPRPRAWLVLGPVELALGATLLFPLDRLAARLAMDTRRRLALLFGATILIWPTVAVWGHPEDILSVTFGVAGLLGTFDGLWWRATALLGLAILFQPLIVMIVPIALAYVPIRKWLAGGAGMLVPTVMAMLVPLIQEWGPTTRMQLQQPSFPAVNHPTPWMSLAPTITAGHWGVVQSLKEVVLPGGIHRLVSVTTKVHFAPVVAGGPSRIAAIILACVIGLFVKWRRPPLPQVLWLAALALSLRCVFEAVMIPYYLVPGLALILVGAARVEGAKLKVAVFAVGVCAVGSYRHLSPWLYFTLMTLTLGVALGLTWPSRPVDNNRLVADS